MGPALALGAPLAALGGALGGAFPTATTTVVPTSTTTALPGEVSELVTDVLVSTLHRLRTAPRNQQIDGGPKRRVQR